jgi:hypothetical protein
MHWHPDGFIRPLTKDSGVTGHPGLINCPFLVENGDLVSLYRGRSLPITGTERFERVTEEGIIQAFIPGIRTIYWSRVALYHPKDSSCNPI